MKVITACIAAVLCSTAVAKTCTWIGGSGKWSVAGNWADGGIPENGDYLVITNSDDIITLENDIDDLEIKRITVTTNLTDSAAAVILTGKKLRFKGSNTAIKTDCIITNSMPLVFSDNTNPSSEPSIKTLKGSAFLEEIELLGRFNARSTSGIIYFRGRVHGEEGYLYSSGANNYNWFYGPVNVKGVVNNYYCSCSMYFYAPGNTWETNSLAYSCSLVAQTENCFPTNMVMRFTEKLPSHSEGANYRLWNFDQTIDRIETGPIVYNAGGEPSKYRINNDMNYSVDLTLKATASASSYVQLMSIVTLIYDPLGDYTQTFVDRAHTTTGKLVVRGGTVESRGNNTFLKVHKLELGKNARFKVSKNDSGSAINPFAEKTAAVFRRGAVVEVCEGVTVTLKSLHVAGIVAPAGLYQALDGTAEGAEKVDWVEGAGLVRVLTAEDATCWKFAMDGDWNAETNWTAGVPTAGKVTYVTAEGGDYVVSLPDGAVIPETMTIGNVDGGARLKIGEGDYDVSFWNWTVDEGGVFEVDEGANVMCDADLTASAVTVNGGGEFIVSGGEIVFTNMQSHSSTVYGFAVSGEGALTGKVTVTGGLLGYIPEVNGHFQVKEGGLFNLQGGTLHVPSMKNAQSPSFHLQGGKFHATGGEFLTTGGTRAAGYGDKYFADEEVVFGGDSVFMTGSDSAIRLTPMSEGRTATVTFRDSARWGTKSGFTKIGLCGGAKGVLNFASDAVHGAVGSYCMLGVLIGCDRGIGEMNVSAGFVPIGSRGLNIGGGYSTPKASEGVEGILRISAGAVSIAAHNGWGWDSDRFVGLVVGNGAYTLPVEGYPYVGKVELSGGSLTNKTGCVVIGIGYGKGTLEQTGGIYRSTITKPFVIGMGGGIGRVEVSGGDFATTSKSSTLYVGGVGTNVYYSSNKNNCSLPPNLVSCGYPIDRHDAQGTLSFSGGTVSIAGSVVLGADGCGTLERVGAAGTITIAEDLVFSNTVENAASCGTLAVKLGADGKVSPVVVNGKVVLDGKARLTVDTGAADVESIGGGILAAAGGVEGSFAEIVFTGANANNVNVRWRADGTLSVVKRSGLTVIVR